MRYIKGALEMRNSIINNSIFPLISMVFVLVSCKTTNYYDEVKRECNRDKSVELFQKMRDSNDASLHQIIDAMADCRKEDIDGYLADIYPKSSDNIKRHIYSALVRNRSKAFINTVADIIINKAQTNQSYEEELKYINEVDKDYLKRRYKEYTDTIERLKREKNYLALDIYLENAKTLARIIGEEIDEKGVKDKIRSIKSEREKEELYSKFVEATNNHDMERAYNIFLKMKSLSLIANSDTARRLESILKEISEVEQKFYDTAHKQDNLMIEIERLKRENKTEDVKRLQSELNAVKSDMVFKKRALDRAAKRLVVARELIEEVMIK